MRKLAVSFFFNTVWRALFCHLKPFKDRHWHLLFVCIGTPCSMLRSQRQMFRRMNSDCKKIGRWVGCWQITSSSGTNSDSFTGTRVWVLNGPIRFWPTKCPSWKLERLSWMKCKTVLLDSFLRISTSRLDINFSLAVVFVGTYLLKAAVFYVSL